MGKEKKEIGMEKLIELLNEYEDTDNWENGYQVEFRESKIISKKFGFIKWLVENDKIDRNNRDLLDKCMAEFDRYPITFDTCKVSDNATDMLLMLLSIQDKPIKELISYLK